jgi:hypothetical protein
MNQKPLRTLHLYLGCFFAPLILYYSLSGAWQVFRFNNLPRRPQIERPKPVEPEAAPEAEPAPPPWRTLLHELSKPHTESTAPGGDPRHEHSRAFDWIAAAMGLGLFSTTLLGVALAWQAPKRRRWVAGSLLAGTLIPIALLMLARA